MDTLRVNTENDADDSDSLSDSKNFLRNIPKRSATVSPAAKKRRHPSKTRRRSDVNLTAPSRGSSLRRPSADNDCKYEQSQYLEKTGNLRKTSSMPSVEQCQKAHVEAIRKLIDSFPIRQTFNQTVDESETWPEERERRMPSALNSDSDADLMRTDIEELQGAAESIQSLSRVLKIPTEIAAISDESCQIIKCEKEGFSSPEGMRRSGIASRSAGHPRGVIQFLPSVKQKPLLPAVDTYTWNKNNHDRKAEADKKNLFRRKTSLPEGYLIYNQATKTDEMVTRSVSIRPTRRQKLQDSDLYNDKESEIYQHKTTNCFTNLNKFSRLLDSLRSTSQSSSGSSISKPWNSHFVVTHSTELETPMLQADLMLWKKRSRASLRRHNEIRNMAIRELQDTEKNFVQCLEYLIQKYMRPLRQPLECTLIDPLLVDKIFYKIPEILIHHQHFLAALNDRLRNFQSDTKFGDILLSHFEKQSMIETYIAFVDNFKTAKEAILEARERPSFEKYYMRCCRDHKNKLDLDSLIISPIQRVPRYELIIKQVVKHTSVEHGDYENLVKAQSRIRELATAINRQKEECEEMEQRLREIEAIVDGLDDLVSSGRSFNRYDLVNIAGPSGNKQRCLFLMSDQIIVTSVKRKSPSARNMKSTPQLLQSTDFLDNNRFKLLLKISLDDIEIGKETLSQLKSAEVELQNTAEDDSIINKMLELSKLLKADQSELIALLNSIRLNIMQKHKSLREQLTSNPQLTNVDLDVATINGMESLIIQFTNADRRAIWETALIEAKNGLRNCIENDQNVIHLKSILTHRTRPGLIFSAASPTIIRSPESVPNIWICTSDKFSGQIAIINVNGEPTIESNTSVGNACIVAICPVPSPKRRRKTSVRSAVNSSNEQFGLELDSSSSETGDEPEPNISRIQAQSTIWVGNDDGEVFVFNTLDNVRLKCREKVARLSLPIDDIVYLDEKVFISISSSSHVQLLYFERGIDGSWNLENPKNVRHDFKNRLRPMIAAVSRLCIASGNSIYFLNPSTITVEKCCQLCSHTAESVGQMTSLGSTIFISMNKSSIIKVVNAFTLEVILEFSISHVLNKVLSSREDIIRKHKMGSLRISALLCCKNRLWIGTSAGIILNTCIAGTKNNWTPSFNVCKAGHIGPCRFLTAVSASSATFAHDVRRRRMSLNAPSLHLDQVYIISGGEGFDDFNTEVREEKMGIDDAVNHLLFWVV